MTSRLPNDIVFTASARAEQEKNGSRAMYARVEERGQFPSRIDAALADFIAKRDSFYLGTASRDGQPYIQHRGGPKGFLKVLDEQTLAFGDLSGNAQYISVGNIAENDRALLFLMDYANQRRFKLWGRAESIEDDEELLQALEVNGEIPERAIVFHVEVWNANCPKHITPRWTAKEVEERVSDLRAEVARLQDLNRDLERQLAEKNGETR